MVLWVLAATDEASWRKMAPCRDVDFVAVNGSEQCLININQSVAVFSGGGCVGGHWLLPRCALVTMPSKSGDGAG